MKETQSHQSSGSSEEHLIGFAAIIGSTAQPRSFLFGDQTPYYSIDYSASMDVVGADILPRDASGWFGQAINLWDSFETLCEYVREGCDKLPGDRIVFLQYSLVMSDRSLDFVRKFGDLPDRFVYLPYLCDNSSTRANARLLGYEVIGHHKMSAIHNMWFQEEGDMLRSEFSSCLNEVGLFSSFQDAERYADTLNTIAPERIPFLVISVKQCDEHFCEGLDERRKA